MVRGFLAQGFSLKGLHLRVIDSFGSLGLLDVKNVVLLLIHLNIVQLKIVVNNTLVPQLRLDVPLFLLDRSYGFFVLDSFAAHFPHQGRQRRVRFCVELLPELQLFVVIFVLFSRR